MVSNSRCAYNRKCKSRSKGNNKKQRKDYLKTLHEKAAKGIRYVDWKLSEAQRNEIAQEYTIIPHSISFRAKKIPNIRNISNKLLKAIHYHFMDGHFDYTTSINKLSNEDYELLELYNVQVLFIKERIILNEEI